MALDKIRDGFAAYFAPEGLRLPESVLASPQRGVIELGNWTVEYLLDGADGRAFLECYATNRFTNDRHVRIGADGSVEPLETMAEFYSFKAEVPEDEERARREFLAHNQRVAAMLKAKGFGGGG